MQKLHLIVLLATLTGCHDFESVTEQRCGNRILEPSAGEDCDQPVNSGALECGQAGAPGACRFRCTTGTCPDGWGCGLDAVCRAPSGVFAEAEIVPMLGEAIRLGDVDGDGIADLVSSSPAALSVLYGSTDARFGAAVTFPISSPEEELVVFPLDDQPGDEIAVSVEDGTLVIPGAPDRRLVPAATPNRVTPTPYLVVPLRAAPPYSSTQQLIIAPDGSLSVSQGMLDVGNIRVPRPAGPAAETVNVAVADLDDAPSAQEFALAIPGAREVLVLSMACDMRNDCELSVRQTIELPPGPGIAGGSFFGDLNGDGTLDLVIAGNDGAVLVGYGGEDGFSALRAERGLGEPRCAMCPPMERPFSVVSDVADLDGDGVSDLISGIGLHRVVPGDGGPTVEQLFRFQTPYIGVKAADLNDDGRADVYGVRPESGDLFLNGDDLAFTRFTVPLADAPHVLTHGDFDGDGRLDLAALDDEGTVSLVFTSDAGYPSLAVPIARADPDASLIIRVRSSSGPTTDGADDLLVFDGAAEFEFRGSSSRRPAALKSLPGSVALTTGGQFPGGPGALVVTSDGPNGWQVMLLSGADLLSAQPFEVRPLRVSDCEFRAVEHWSQAIDLDDDGIDEVVAIELRVPSAMGSALSMFVLEIDAESARCRQSVEMPGGSTVHSSVIADVDADGSPDMLTWAEATPPLMGMGASEPALLYWRGRPGGFEAPEALDSSEAILAVGAAVLGNVAKPTWLAVRDGQVATLKVDGSAFEALFAAPPDVESMATGDIDGDGLADIIVKTATNAFVSRQTECDARSFGEGQCTRTDPASAAAQ